MGFNGVCGKLVESANSQSHKIVFRRRTLLFIIAYGQNPIFRFGSSACAFNGIFNGSMSPITACFQFRVASKLKKKQTTLRESFIFYVSEWSVETFQEWRTLEESFSFHTCEFYIGSFPIRMIRTPRRTLRFRRMCTSRNTIFSFRCLVCLWRTTCFLSELFRNPF